MSSYGEDVGADQDQNGNLVGERHFFGDLFSGNNGVVWMRIPCRTGEWYELQQSLVNEIHNLHWKAIVDDCYSVLHPTVSC